MAKTIVLGAGMAGLTAARALQAAGHQVEVIDKGRGVGGRMATRRVGDARIDHGAQFFTTRGPAFTELVAAAVEAGVVAEWCLGFGEPDGYPRYRGSDGMTSMMKWLAQGVDVRLDQRVDRIERTHDNVRFVAADGRTIAEAPSAVVTAPIPQMVELFDRASVVLPPQVDDALRSARYHATLALLAVVEGGQTVAEPGGMQLEHGPFTFVADNLRKGISPVRALTFHAEHDYSLRRYDDDPDEVAAELMAMAAPWLDDVTIVQTQLKKWRYAGPVTPLPDPTIVLEHGSTTIALAGDAFAGPKVEGAHNSGRAAAEAVLDRS